MKKISLLVILCLSMFLLASCGAKTAENNENNQSQIENLDENSTENKADYDYSTINEIKERGYITVATSPDYPPYEFKIIEKGKEKVVGFDIALVDEIAKDLGVDLKIVEMSFDGILLELKNGNVDIAIAGFSPTEERKKSVDFSDIYYNSSQSVLMKKENISTINDIVDLSDKKIGVQLSSIQENIAKEQIPNPKLVSLSKLSNIVMDLKNGNIDAAIVETPVAEGYAKQFPELALANIKIYEETGGSAIAIKKGNQSLVDAINDTIKRVTNEGLMDKFVFEANKLIGS